MIQFFRNLRKPLAFTAAATLVTLALLLTGCGTDTGNPGAAPAYSGVTDSTESQLLTSATCTKLQACFSADYSSCQSALPTATGLTSALGLNPTHYPTLVSTNADVATGLLHTSSPNATTCANAISNLTCGNPLVTTAYSPGQPTNFNNAYHLVSASAACQAVITQ